MVTRYLIKISLIHALARMSAIIIREHHTATQQDHLVIKNPNPKEYAIYPMSPRTFLGTTKYVNRNSDFDLISPFEQFLP